MTALVLMAALILAPDVAVVRAEAAAWQAAAAGDRDAYREGTEALDRGEWARAERAFATVAAQKGARADAALYWRAYALNKAGRRADALQLVAELRRAHPESRWLRDAQALELEMRQASGQAPAPEAQADEELKLMALGGLMNADPERAIPLLESFLAGNRSEKLRDRALFVLAQSGDARARQTLARIAKGQDRPELQAKAIRYLGLFGGEESRAVLEEVYAGNNPEARKAVLHALMVAGDRGRLATLARSEPSPELRAEAIRQLGLAGGGDDLWGLYKQEQNAEVRKTVLQALFLAGRADRLGEVATGDASVELRKAAIHNLGLIGQERSSAVLAGLYTPQADVEIRRAVLHALFLQNNAKAMIEIARKEPDVSLRKQAVHWLSLMKSKEATDYMLELLK